MSIERKPSSAIDLATLPAHFDASRAEEYWDKQWAEWKLYDYDDTRSREETFVVDTPPPTVSGSLHIGHVFSYTQTDVIVRYQRMCGRNIFYPMGWDDNGLPTERRVQNYFHVRCEAGVSTGRPFGHLAIAMNSATAVRLKGVISDVMAAVRAKSYQIEVREDLADDIFQVLEARYIMDLENQTPFTR